MQSVMISHEEVMRLRQVLEDDDSRVDTRLLSNLRTDHIQLKVLVLITNPTVNFQLYRKM